ncbi:MAG: pyridoxal-phosphate dependent enzyme, partial [Cytophagales bacterium]|nr:pyridoxal-phosphate dependent enzyme [Cytophagales bacterium]
LAKGLRKHNRNIKVVAADPFGSILALPETLNESHANKPYKIEGIGYDFIPDVLDRETVDAWYKTDDRESFLYARRLIAEEGLLVGGSSGSAIVALERAVKDLKLSKSDTVVVVLPDSIRSYLSKFADDDWLAANDLLPSEPAATSSIDGNAQQVETEQEKNKKNMRRPSEPFIGATIRSLRLKPVTSILSTSPCAEAIETMRDKGFDQLPVLSPTGGKLVGLVTLGNLLSYISRGRASRCSPISDVMFDFRRIDEVVTDPRDLVAEGENPSTTGGKKRRRRLFVEITMDTPLSALSKFFEWNSAAVVTERTAAEGSRKPVAVVTKVDLLTWMVKGMKA